MNAQIKKVTVWLLATSLVLAAAAMLIPKKAVAAIAAQVFLVNHSVPASNPLPVNVTNPSLPITGNVGINNMPPVQLAPGTTVGVTGGTFNFSNTPSTPIFTNPVQTPFQTTLCAEDPLFEIRLSACTPRGLPSFLTVVPPQRVVIEFVSVECNQSSGTVFGSHITTTAGSAPGQYSFPIGQQDDQKVARFNQQVRIYADPGTQINLAAIGVSGSLRPFFCIATLSGNLVTP